MNWKLKIDQAINSAKDASFTFQADLSCHAQFNGPVSLIAAIIEPDHEHDEESLPLLKVRNEQEAVFEATCEELSCSNARVLANLTEVISQPFSWAREAGWAGPSQLMSEGTASDQSALRVMIDKM